VKPRQTALKLIGLPKAGTRLQQPIAASLQGAKFAAAVAAAAGWHGKPL
jgi:hypothetical protein